jgi:hypothetical protein
LKAEVNERLAAIGLGRPAADPVQVARPGALVRQTIRVQDGRHDRDALCELDLSGIRITGPQISRMITWPDARSISVERGRTHVVSPVGSIAMMVVLDGVNEPGLAPLFARVLEEGRAGMLASATGARHEFAVGIDRVMEEFADADDPIVPIAIGVLAVAAGLVLLAAIPTALQIVAHVQPEPGTFAVMPHIAFFDPRTIVAAFAAAGALAVVVGRFAVGTSATVWARGALRGWHRNAHGIEAAARRALAWLMLDARKAALIAAIAILTLVPSAFARTTVDQSGIHHASGLPFISRDRSWGELVEVLPIAVGFSERPEGFATRLVFADGSDLSTRGRDLAGGSERAFYDLVRAHAR